MVVGGVFTGPMYHLIFEQVPSTGLQNLRQRPIGPQTLQEPGARRRLGPVDGIKKLAIVFMVRSR